MKRDKYLFNRDKHLQRAFKSAFVGLSSSALLLLAIPAAGAAPGDPDAGQLQVTSALHDAESVTGQECCRAASSQPRLDDDDEGDRGEREPLPLPEQTTSQRRQPPPTPPPRPQPRPHGG
ncbi:MAG: hypothetical protein ACQEXJ_20390, partial [Myxococcota bacterium]